MSRPEAKAPYLKRRRWRAHDARAALDAAASTGLSVSEFAKREGLVAERLSRWQRRLLGNRRPSRVPRLRRRRRSNEVILVAS